MKGGFSHHHSCVDLLVNIDFTFQLISPKTELSQYLIFAFVFKKSSSRIVSNLSSYHDQTSIHNSDLIIGGISKALRVIQTNVIYL